MHSDDSLWHHPSRLPGEGRDPWRKWAPAFAGVTAFLMCASAPIRPIAARYMQIRRSNPMRRRVPRLKTDAEAEAFLEQDLSDLDFSKFTTVRFEFEPKTERVSMRL